MGKIDFGRIVVGGIVAGIVINAIEFVLNGIVLGDQWNSVVATHNLPMMGMNAILLFNILGFVLGFAAIWTYAAIRPRFGSGPMTAVYAALLIWVVGYLCANGFMVGAGMVPLSMMITLTIVGLVEIILATVAGAYFYKEESAGLVSPAAAR